VGVRVVVAVVMIVTVLVIAKALTGGGIHGYLRRPFPIEAILGLASRPDAEEATEPVAPLGGAAARRTRDVVDDRGRGEDLVGRAARATAVVDQWHAASLRLPRGQLPAARP
jgi:hypothetical protein